MRMNCSKMRHFIVPREFLIYFSHLMVISAQNSLFLTKSGYAMLVIHVRKLKNHKPLPGLWNTCLGSNFHRDIIFRTFFKLHGYRDSLAYIIYFTTGFADIYHERDLYLILFNAKFHQDIHWKWQCMKKTGTQLFRQILGQ